MDAYPDPFGMKARFEKHGLWGGDKSLVGLDNAAPAKDKSCATNKAEELEHTPTTHPEEFEPVRGSPGKRHKTPGEIWEHDRLHKDHYEVYKNKESR